MHAYNYLNSRRSGSAPRSDLLEDGSFHESVLYPAALSLRPGLDAVAAVDADAGTGTVLDECFADEGVGSVAVADFDDDNAPAAAEADALP